MQPQRVRSQQISITVKNATLARYLPRIEKQSDFNFVYTRKLIHDANPVTISVTNAES